MVAVVSVVAVVAVVSVVSVVSVVGVVAVVCLIAVESVVAELWRSKLACGAPWVSKSTHPRKLVITCP